MSGTPLTKEEKNLINEIAAGVPVETKMRAMQAYGKYDRFYAKMEKKYPNAKTVDSPLLPDSIFNGALHNSPELSASDGFKLKKLNEEANAAYIDLGRATQEKAATLGADTRKPQSYDNLFLHEFAALQILDPSRTQKAAKAAEGASKLLGKKGHDEPSRHKPRPTAP